MKYSLVHGNSYLEKKQSAKWLIKGWVPESGLMMIYGAPGSGKSFIALDMMLSISTGKPVWQGYRIAQKSKSIVYFCGEGEEGISQRISAWVQENNSGETDTGNFYVLPTACNLNEKQTVKELMEVIDKSIANTLPCLIVIDTMNMYFAGDENNARDARDFIFACRQLGKKYDALIMIIHHTGKSKVSRTEARGSSAFHGSMDSEILVSNYTGNVTIESKKQKNSKNQEPIFLKLKVCELNGWEKDEDGEIPTSLVVETQEKNIFESILQEIADLKQTWILSEKKFDKELEYPYVTKEDLKEYFKKEGKSKDFIYNAFRPHSNRFLSKLISAGIIEEKEKDVFCVIHPKVIDELIAELNT